ncbi:hypothetical protein EDC01DRAFT_665434 [Geopyxis carbonaria]|nr:hypothetical protein EDC01DRAFT_665434 [Geopyxis carbonaria]
MPIRIQATASPLPTTRAPHRVLLFSLAAYCLLCPALPRSCSCSLSLQTQPRFCSLTDRPPPHPPPQPLRLFRIVPACLPAGVVLHHQQRQSTNGQTVQSAAFQNKIKILDVCVCLPVRSCSSSATTHLARVPLICPPSPPPSGLVCPSPLAFAHPLKTHPPRTYLALPLLLRFSLRVLRKKTYSSLL